MQKRIVHVVVTPKWAVEGTTEVAVDAFMRNRGLLSSYELRLLQDQLGSIDAGDDEVDLESIEAGTRIMEEEEFLMDCQQDCHYPALGDLVYQ